MDLFSNKKKIFFSLFGVLLFLIIIEIFSFILLNIFSSEYKSKEKFNVREFNELVNDDRFFTMKKEISLNFKSGDKKFSIITDKYGFRINNLKKKRYNENFIDKCCHLSNLGADKVAKELNKIINKLTYE